MTRILRYSMSLAIRPWADFKVVKETEVREDALLSNSFDDLCKFVKKKGFDYIIVDQPDEVLIAKGPKK